MIKGLDKNESSYYDHNRINLKSDLQSDASKRNDINSCLIV